jgi:hypothetical protein
MPLFFVQMDFQNECQYIISLGIKKHYSALSLCSAEDGLAAEGIIRHLVKNRDVIVVGSLIVRN